MRLAPLKMKILVLALALGATCCLTVAATRATAAYFQDTKPGTITGTPGWSGPPYLSFAPGCSKAANPNSCGCPKGVLIASADAQGNLSLDFGGVYEGSCMAWPDVFRITSSAPGPLHVSFTVSGAIAPLLASVTFANDTTGGELDAGQTRSVAVKLNVSAQAIHGTYSGTLVVAVVGSSESYSIPMVISVLSRKGGPSPVVLPVTSCDYDGCWHNGPVTLHFSANDCGGYGLAYTEYSLDNGVTWTQGTSVTISSAGTTTVLYHSVDIVGNVEVPKSVTVKIDLTAPTTTASASPSSGWTKGPVTLTLAATDSGGSGLKATYYKIDGQSQQTYSKPVSLTTGSTVTYWSVDKAGNSEQTHSFTPQIDTTAPTTTATAAPSGWTNGSVTLTLAASDSGGSGLKAIYYKIDGQSQQTYSAPVKLTSATAVTYWSVDNAGNSEKTHSFTPQIDTTPPVVTITAPVNGTSYKLGAKVIASWTATDALSGINAALTTSSPVANGKAIDTSTTGSKTFTVTATDNAGNVTIKTATYTVTKPK
jgi:Chitobiase/beta-hexosaminidase C-terminal domain